MAAQSKEAVTDKVQVPSIGRNVYFVHGSRHVPAIIIDPAQNDGERITQALHVMTVEHGAFVTFANYDPDGTPATWHWPEPVLPSEQPAK